MPLASSPARETATDTTGAGGRAVGPLRRLAPALLGLAVVLGIYGHLLLPGKVLVSRDVPTLHLPLRHDFAQLLASGSGLPTWNPWINSGQPILSNPHYAAWYPPTWLLAVFPVHVALQLEIVLHALLAFAGAFLLARHLGCRRGSASLAAVAFAGGGPFVALAGMPLMLFGFAWLPWILLAGDRALRAGSRTAALRAGCLAALAWGLQILNGDPAAVMSTGLALALLAWSATERERWRAPWVRLGSIAVVAVLVGAVQVVPTWLRLRDSARGGAGLAVEQAAVWSARPARLVELVAPHAFGDATRDEEDLYFGWTLHDRGYPFLLSISPGLLPLVLAFALVAGRGAPRRALWLGAVALGLFFGLGRHNPLFAGLHAHLPFLSMVRYPEKFLLLPLLCLPFAAGLGWERALELWRENRRFRLPILAAAVCAVLAAGAALYVSRPGVGEAIVQAASWMPLNSPQANKGAVFLRQAAWIAAANAVLVLAFLFAARARARSSRVAIAGWLAAAPLLLIALEIGHYGRRFLPTMPAARFFERPAVTSGLAPGERVVTDDAFRRGPAVGARVGEPGTYQVRGRLATLTPYTANLWGLAHALNEDLDLMLTGWARLPLTAFHRAWPEPGEQAAVAHLLDAWDVRAIVRARTPQEMLPEMRAGKAPAPAAIETRPARLPRFRAPVAVMFHRDLPSALRDAQHDGFAVELQEHVIGGGIEGRVERFAPPARLVARELGGSIELDVQSSTDCVIVAAVTFDEGWSAERAGESIPLWPTALGQIAFRLPPGDHSVRLRYRDPAVALGGAISAITLLLGVIVVRRAMREEGRV